jgi:hypothetical protein
MGDPPAGGSSAQHSYFERLRDLVELDLPLFLRFFFADLQTRWVSTEEGICIHGGWIRRLTCRYQNRLIPTAAYPDQWKASPRT